MDAIWKHGKYLDTWSIVHFLSGCLLAILFYKLDLSFGMALLISLLILIAWEVFEWSIKIIEPSLNVITDLIVGFLGVLVGAYPHYVLNVSFGAYFYVILAFTTLLATWGFLDFLKRGYR